MLNRSHASSFRFHQMNERLIYVQAISKCTCMCIKAHISSISIIRVFYNHICNIILLLYRLLTSIIFEFSIWNKKDMFNTSNEVSSLFRFESIWNTNVFCCKQLKFIHNSVDRLRTNASFARIEKSNTCEAVCGLDYGSV